MRGNLKRHSQSCVRKDTRDIGQMFFSHDMSMRKSSFDPEKFRKKLVAAVIMHDLPLSSVEYTGIRALLSYLREEVVFISRNTCKANTLKMHKREKNKIKCMLEEAPGKIGLAFDLWTSITTDGYLSLTVHFIDKDWELHKRVLNFSYMPPPHRGVALSEKVNILLVEWGIETKLFSLTLDNASSNDVFVDMLKSHLNVKKSLLLLNADIYFFLEFDIDTFESEELGIASQKN
ncbi:zinc finger BED domain-containing protein RICESLEEPER 1-like [Elaeis guineensis]|uniref:zinc finger BED domain-containing protein RICESLEEPER 1-like n=1 Tax=Elaeis guineensis var. tenera TaxID=51953 RepID=UPI003C6DB08C